MRLRHLLLSTTLLLAAQTANAASYGKHDFAATSVLSEGLWVKVAADGDKNRILQISYCQLRDMGFAHPEHVQVYGYGGHVLSENLDEVEYDDLPLAPMVHDAAQNRLLFAAHGMVKWSAEGNRHHHRRNVYETQGYYFLHETEEATHPSDSILYNHPLTLLHEEELVNIGQSGREKYGESFVSNKKQTFKLGTLGAGDFNLRINAITKADAQTSYTVLVNGAEMGKISVSATSGSYSFASEGWYEETIHLDTESELEVTLQYEPGSAKVELARLNYIEAVGNWATDAPGYTQITLEKALEMKDYQFASVKVIGRDRKSVV